MKREVDVERARIAWNFLQLPYVKRATLLQEFALPGAEPHEEILSEVLDRLTSEGRLEEFGERVTAKMGMIQPGGTMDDLPKVRECIPVAKSESDAISLAFSENSPVAFLDTENGTGGVCGLFANTHGARAERGEVPAEIVAAGERIGGGAMARMTDEEYAHFKKRSLLLRFIRRTIFLSCGTLTKLTMILADLTMGRSALNLWLCALTEKFAP